MVSAWWMVWAFFVGAYAGVLLMALMKVVPQGVDEPKMLSGD